MQNADPENHRPDGTTDDDEVVIAARDWVVRLASKDLTERELQAFKVWHGASEAHRRVFETERRFWQRLGRLVAEPDTAETVPEAEPPSPTRHIRPMRGHGRRPGAAPGRRRKILAGSLVAACLALLVMVGDDGLLGPAPDHATDVGVQRSVRLPDGSMVHLNTDSAIDLTYNDRERAVTLLRGEAQFDVLPDSARPFRVAAEGGMAEAVGTRFIVRLEDGSVRVTVSEGKVLVSSPADGDPPRSQLVEAGQANRYAPGGPPGPVEVADLASVTAWRRGKIRIDGLTLERALTELDRYLPGTILLIAASEDGFDAVSGAFDIDHVPAAVDGLAATHGLSVTRIAGLITILR
ncbi:FecR domain-containing protein [Marivibrio halodurans]|uniref:FecR domain-containing protein n=1 Tax=Marivibrio halodurans TaxID=2039722 RepID=A0A8J7V135_9PROT|nr:FecR domain-containing protein [Marivibrio halodurans]MBP5855900.1 FecR domain-containing protein [Marivibrio halodurans]